MMEVIHDVAPGAALAFHRALEGQADFARGILDLQNAGADVIVDDIIYLDEPMFQDGIIAQAVDRVVAHRAAYFAPPATPPGTPTRAPFGRAASS